MNKKKELMMYASAILLGVVSLGLISASKAPLFLQATPPVHKIVITPENPLGYGIHGFEALFGEFPSGTKKVNTVEGSTRLLDYHNVGIYNSQFQMHTLNGDDIADDSYSYIGNSERIGSLLSVTLSDVSKNFTMSVLDIYWGWNYYTRDAFMSKTLLEYDTDIYPGYERITVGAETTVTFDFNNEKPTYFYMVNVTAANESASLYFSQMEITYRDNLGGCEPSPAVTAQVVEGNLLYHAPSDAGYNIIASLGGAELGDVVVPSTVNGKPVIGVREKAFADNVSLRSITLPSSVTTIGVSAFENCTSLREVVMPGVVEIQNFAFKNCIVLETATLPETLTSIGSESFAYANLSTLHIPAALTTLNLYAFKGNPFTAITVDPTNTVFDSRGNCNALIRKGTTYPNLEVGSSATVVPTTISSIGASSFYGNHELTSIHIPDNVTSIGSDAFDGCSSLATVTFGSEPNIHTIHSSAFRDCRALTNITLPNSITYLGSAVFANCSSLVAAHLPTSITHLTYDVFTNCTSLSGITLHEGLRSISSNSFFNCRALTAIHIPSTIEKVNSQAFAGTGPSLTSITVDPTNIYYNDGGGNNVLFEIASETVVVGCVNSVLPSTVKIIDVSAFQDCTNLTAINLPYGLKTIYAYAFKGCTSLTAIDLPDSLQYGIPTQTFAECTSLATVNFHAGMTYIDELAFFNCESLTAISIPASCENIGQWAFYRASKSLTSIQVNAANPNYRDGTGSGGGNVLIGSDPESGEEAVLLTCINSVLPTDVHRIAQLAYAGSDWLTSFEVPAHIGMLSMGALGGCDNLVNLSVVPGHEVLDSRDGCNGIIYTAMDMMVVATANTVVPAGVSTIYLPYVFNTNLTNFTIPAGIKRIGPSMFYACKNLTSLTISSEVTDISSYVFESCSNLTTVVIPSTVLNVKEYAFSESSLTTIFLEFTQRPAVWPMYWNYGLPLDTFKWYSATPNYDGNHWHYVAGVPTIWVE